MRQFLLAGVMCLVAGCADPEKAVGFDHNDPAARFRAVKEAARTEDPEAVDELIGRLESDDAAERLLAIRALERITGETLGYDHAAPRPQRREAIARWVEWHREHGAQPAPRRSDE